MKERPLVVAPPNRLEECGGAIVRTGERLDIVWINLDLVKTKEDRDTLNVILKRLVAAPFYEELLGGTDEKPTFNGLPFVDFARFYGQSTVYVGRTEDSPDVDRLKIHWPKAKEEGTEKKLMFSP